ncbi:unnamed protein product [Cuscuta epithymum]|uniref:CCHC-type domain-containing protein n=1 Tax=Cuscuta epithymum TaxID=186058 RepID=A0AAV0D3L2_9ASTE|nr:unnamed protein product [Cuscuta epithymum]
MEITTTTTLVHLNAPTNFPVKLSASNFPIWRRQVEATLVGYDLLPYVDGTITIPSKFSDDDKLILNPCYSIWYRQDQILLSAFIGSCTDPVQSLLSSALTAKDAWDTLLNSYANASPGHILALKSKLSRNPRGNRSISDYLKDMQAIAGELALAQCPVSDTDLHLSILNQLGDDYRPIISALRVRNTATSMLELSNILTDHERLLKESEEATSTLLATANITQRHTPEGFSAAASRPREAPFPGGSRSTYSKGGQRGPLPSHGPPRSGSTTGRSTPICRFCNFAGHVVKDCRKLARFLRENHITTAAPVVNTTVTHGSPIGTSQPWLFDSGASHHATSSVDALQEFSTYDGPDEIRLGNGPNHRESAHER